MQVDACVFLREKNALQIHVGDVSIKRPSDAFVRTGVQDLFDYVP